jgi:mannose-6-phosphate isomerase-like protein (cupin superfamily)
MATHFPFAEMVAFGAIAPGQIVSMPVIAQTPSPRYRIRDVSVSALGPGTWPSHTERAPELYIILRGEVIYQTPSRRFVVTAGEGILFATGDSHATEIPQGLLSVAINLIEL